MPTIKKKQPSTQFPSASHSVESVREWRHVVEEFFSEDWPKLTELILSIEESQWVDAEQVKTPEVFDEKPLDATESHTRKSMTSEPDFHRTQHESVPVAAEPEQQRRLEELAKKIEERLKKTDKLNEK